jgi:hypothetical protein
MGCTITLRLMPRGHGLLLLELMERAQHEPRTFTERIYAQDTAQNELKLEPQAS